MIILGMISTTIMYKMYKSKMAQALEQLSYENKIIQQTMSTFSSFIDNKDPYTREHSTRVAAYTREIVKRMGFSEQEKKQDKSDVLKLLELI